MTSNLSGTTPGYLPQWRAEGEWKNVPNDRVQGSAPGAIPAARYQNAGIVESVDLSTRAQAHALAWQWAASCEAEGKRCEVRVVKYAIRYEISVEPAPPKVAE